MRAKRARLRPERFDLPRLPRRRVAGLRREELALLAGISLTWYTLLESGSSITVSPALLRRLSDVLELAPIERLYLFSLALEEMDVPAPLLSGMEILSGCRIAGDSLVDEIAMVLRTHRALKAQIYGALLHEALDELRPHLDERRCPIGIWLHDDLGTSHRGSPHYDAAARVHAAFHREIDAVVRAALDSGLSPQVERLVAAPGRYAQASSELEDAFSAWRSDRLVCR